jgi:pilus assembly protein Flp/PilA
MLNRKNISKKNQSGVTMIEYALIAALVAIAAILALTGLGTDIAAKFTSIGTAISGAGS